MLPSSIRPAFHHSNTYKFTIPSFKNPNPKMSKKKMKLIPFLFKTPEAPTSWPWPACGTPKTLSFRASPPPPELEDSGDPIEAVIRGLRSAERLFFQPGETSSILEEAKSGGEVVVPFKESVVVAMDSRNPFMDFKRSMEEMVEAYGLRDWERLEELLSCYLKVNGKNNHGYIVGAYVELLVGLALASESSSSTSSSENDRISSPASQLSFSSSSFSTSPCLSSLEADQDEAPQTEDNANAS